MRRKARTPTGPDAHSRSGRGPRRTHTAPSAERGAGGATGGLGAGRRAPAVGAWVRASLASWSGAGAAPIREEGHARAGRPEEPTCSAPGRVTAAERADVRRLGGEGAARPAPDAAACVGARAPRGRQAGPRRLSGRKPLVGVRGGGSSVSPFPPRL